ncbi:hypothetical protein FS749_008054 [Ceratobasidium sp. UAMH 11750]|nr:hypothetical protein FS749_008054 [Ceratobasidium sp. UAMH 11750]
MSDQARLTKKGRYAPPKAPQTPAGSSSLRPDHPRSESVLKATPAPLPASKYRSSSAYPTPSTVRKPEQGTGTRVKSMPPLDFNAATAPPPELEAAGNPDSESLSEDEGDKSSSDSHSDGGESDGSDASDAYKGEDEVEEDDEQDEQASKGVVRELAKEVIKLDDSPRKKKGKFRNAREMEDYIASLRRNAHFEESDAEDPPVAPKPTSSKVVASKSASSKSVVSKSTAPEPDAPKSTVPKGASSSKSSSKSAAPKSAPSKSAPSKSVAPKSTAPKSTAPKSTVPESASSEHPGPLFGPLVEAKVEEDVKMEEGNVVVDDYNRVIVRAHVLKCMTSLCGLKKAHDAANITPLYDESGEPKWFKKEGETEVLVPHFDRPFQENMDGWGKIFDEVVNNPSRMPEKDRAHLQTLSGNTFRSVLSAGAFATMKEAWKKNKDGKGEEWQEKKRARTRRGNRKKAVSILI